MLHPKINAVLNTEMSKSSDNATMTFCNKLIQSMWHCNTEWKSMFRDLRGLSVFKKLKTKYKIYNNMFLYLADTLQISNTDLDWICSIMAYCRLPQLWVKGTSHYDRACLFPADWSMWSLLPVGESWYDVTCCLMEQMDQISQPLIKL